MHAHLKSLLELCTFAARWPASDTLRLQVHPELYDLIHTANTALCTRPYSFWVNLMSGLTSCAFVGQSLCCCLHQTSTKLDRARRLRRLAGSMRCCLAAWGCPRPSSHPSATCASSPSSPSWGPLSLPGTWWRKPQQQGCSPSCGVSPPHRASEPLWKGAQPSYLCMGAMLCSCQFPPPPPPPPFPPSPAPPPDALPDTKLCSCQRLRPPPLPPPRHCFPLLYWLVPK